MAGLIMDPVYLHVRKPIVVPASPGAFPLAFFLLFPGFFFYQTSISLGALPAFLGGYFTIVSIAVFLPLNYAYYRALKRAGYRVGVVDLQFGFFLLYFLLVVAANAMVGSNAAVVQAHLLSILYFVNVYIIFKYLDFSRRNIRLTALFSLVLMSATIFLFSQGGSFQPGLLGASQDMKSVATYQGFARSYALTFIAVICFTRSILLRFGWYVIAIVALFLNGARSELAAVLLLVPVIEAYWARSWLHALFIVLLAMTLTGIGFQAVMEHFPDNRVWELLDLSQSESAKGRYGLTQRALQTIAEHPVLGDYASYTAGTYSHNILSAWVDLGVFGFGYLVLMLVHAAAWLFVKGWFSHHRNGHFLLAWSLICASLVLLATAKTFNDMLIGAAMGAYANYRAWRGQSRQGG